MGRQGNTALSAEELSVFCEQLALLLQAGISGEEAVDMLREDTPPGPGLALLERISAVLREGAQLSDALSAAGSFPHYLIRMVEIGQTSGQLDQVLAALSAYYRREAATAAAIRRAVLYPAVMAVLVALIFLLLITRVLPVFQQVFDQLGISLSPVAQGLLAAGQAGKYIGSVLLLLLAAGAVVLLVLSRCPGGSARLQTKLLSLGGTGRALDRGSFASAMALMLSSGLPLDEAMTHAIRLLEGSSLSGQLTQCAAQMEAGTEFTKAVADCGLLKGTQAGLLRAGFRSGTLERSMEDLAARCQEEADDRLHILLNRMEFALLLVLCGAVGLVLLSVMLPLLGVLSAIG